MKPRPSTAPASLFWGKQGFYAGVTLCSLIGVALALPTISILVLHIVLTLFYLANFLVRLYALRAAGRQERLALQRARALPPVAAGPVPVYSVLVALYREESVVAQLVHALNQIDWPRSRLDIKLICEADDAATIAAIKGFAAGARIRDRSGVGPPCPAPSQRRSPMRCPAFAAPM